MCELYSFRLANIYWKTHQYRLAIEEKEENHRFISQRQRFCHPDMLLSPVRI